MRTVRCQWPSGRGCPSRGVSASGPEGTPLLADTPQGRHPQCMLGYTHPCPVHAGIHTLPVQCPVHVGIHTPSPVDRILDTLLWKRYLSATSFADGNKYASGRMCTIHLLIVSGGSTSKLVCIQVGSASSFAGGNERLLPPPHRPPPPWLIVFSAQNICILRLNSTPPPQLALFNCVAYFKSSHCHEIRGWFFAVAMTLDVDSVFNFAYDCYSWKKPRFNRCYSVKDETHCPGISSSLFRAAIKVLLSAKRQMLIIN